MRAPTLERGDVAVDRVDASPDGRRYTIVAAAGTVCGAVVARHAPATVAVVRCGRPHSQPAPAGPATLVHFDIDPHRDRLAVATIGRTVTVTVTRT